MMLQLQIASLPPVLVLHLKRFFYSADEVKKVSKEVRYGPVLEFPANSSTYSSHHLEYLVNTILRRTCEAHGGGEVQALRGFVSSRPLCGWWPLHARRVVPDPLRSSFCGAN